jgi:hypothetical protein
MSFGIIKRKHIYTGRNKGLKTEEAGEWGPPIEALM